MAAARVVTVFGATGAQGGAVVKQLLKDPAKWKVVAVTRDPNSEKAKALSAQGVEVRKADLSKYEEVEAAMKGTYGVFGVTNFWEARSKEKEVEQGKNIINAAKKNNVQHLVLSTLENSTKISEGKRPVEHFDSKAEIEEHLLQAAVPYTIVQPSFYYENYKEMTKYNPEIARLELVLPVPGDCKFPQYSVGDTGLVVGAVLNDIKKHGNKKIALVGDYLTPHEVTYQLSKQFGKPVRYTAVAESAYAALPFVGAKEIGNMFCFFQEYGYYGEKKAKRDIWECKSVAPGMLTLMNWSKDWKP